ncbi:MAG: transcription-repair coupling factor [Cellvibrionaceae bacterium]|nr:transcription-repair coupling factor [Cellvibrionaceae bacterium]
MLSSTPHSPLRSPLHPPTLTTAGNKQRWGGLQHCAQALAISASAQQPHPLLVITADTASAVKLHHELCFFTTADANIEVLHFPDWETLPYDHFSPHADLISSRLYSLHKITRMRQGIIVVSITTLMHVLAPTQYLHQHSFVLKKGEQFDSQQMRRQLETAGYRPVDTVYSHGEFATRGALFDLYPMGSKLPYRIELFDDSVESLRTFDPETQRGIDKAEQIFLLPAREFPLDEDGIRQFRTQWHQRFDNDHRQCDMYQYVSDGIAPAGIEYFLPLFFEQCATLFDYLPEHTHIMTQSGLEAAGDHYWQEVNQRYESRRGDLRHPILPPAALFAPTTTIFAAIKTFSHSLLTDDTSTAHIHYGSQVLPDLSADIHQPNTFERLEKFIQQHRHYRLLFCVESAGRRQALLDALSPLKVRPASIDHWQDFIDDERYTLAIIEAPLDQGCLIDEPAIGIITETELFGQQVKQRRRRQTKHNATDAIVKSLSELRIGSPVVHIDHGVGRYQGLQNLAVDGQNTEFLCLEYADNAKLYVPVTHLHLINRYAGAEDGLAPLHKLGSEQWQKSKDKAAREVRDVAAELLEIYAQRDARKGFAFSLNKADYQRFAAAFPFEETPDQEAAIEAVIDDMLSEKPMDRLVCGDVGFGKTEVAMRAAFIAIEANKQIAVLVPTTLLAQQHYENFRDRFADWPVEIAVVSRFKTPKETREIEAKVNNGKIDILIGTHKILSSDFAFKSLGLLIVDEEHRFGVRQKEAMKSLRSEVDILTLTATPIPRTLNMAMNGIRDLSIIATPPARRLSVKTFVRQYDDNLIKEATLREILRGGQVYFLHNDVKTIEKTQRELAELVPEARIAIAHGQLRERTLEHIMSEFYHQHFNILLCSTIIETGIDVPNANTIIIERADKFGLAQLHQLRGRVGRSHHQAYAYLLTPPSKVMSSDAEKRLEAISQADTLGAGFTLASHDLEIRGAGELLGEDQSGQMHTIGFSLYMSLLEQTVKAMRSGQTLDETTLLFDNNTDINLHIPALIPDNYIPDVHTRLNLYKRLSTLETQAAFDDFAIEMIDRFGLLPNEVKHLISVTQLKVRAQALGITKIDANSKQCRIEIGAKTEINPVNIVKMVQRQPQLYQLRGGNQLLCHIDSHSAADRLKHVEQLIEKLTQP